MTTANAEEALKKLKGTLSIHFLLMSGSRGGYRGLSQRSTGGRHTPRIGQQSLLKFQLQKVPTVALMWFLQQKLSKQWSNNTLVSLFRMVADLFNGCIVSFLKSNAGLKLWTNSEKYYFNNGVFPKTEEGGGVGRRRAITRSGNKWFLQILWKTWTLPHGKWDKINSIWFKFVLNVWRKCSRGKVTHTSYKLE